MVASSVDDSGPHVLGFDLGLSFISKCLPVASGVGVDLGLCFISKCKMVASSTPQFHVPAPQVPDLDTTFVLPYAQGKSMPRASAELSPTDNSSFPGALS